MQQTRAPIGIASLKPKAKFSAFRKTQLPTISAIPWTRFCALATALCALLAAGETAQATITINSVTGASYYSQVAASSTTQASNTIYAGLAGASPGADQLGNCPSIANTTATCNNCVASTATGDSRLTPCNQTMITDASLLQISFTSSSATGFPQMTAQAAATGTTGTAGSVVTQNTVPGQVAQGTAATVSVQWQQLCSNANLTGTGGTAPGSASCIALPTGGYQLSIVMVIQDANQKVLDSSLALTVTIARLQPDAALALSNNYSTSPTSPACQAGSYSSTDSGDTGICYFELRPGDQLANVGNVLADTNFATGNEFVSPNVPFSAVQFFYYSTPSTTFDQTQFANINPFSTNTQSSTIAVPAVSTTGSSPSLSGSRINGLSDNTGVYMKAAMVDQAGNVGFFTADEDDYLTCSPTFPVANACHFVTPSQVLGVLANSLNCFVATAAYGSIMAPQVQIFRQFRDTYLETSGWGRKFVRSYYEHSPKYANIIARNETLRAISRAALAPLLLYAWLALRFGALAAAAIVSLLGALIWSGVWFATKRGLPKLKLFIRRRSGPPPERDAGAGL